MKANHDLNASKDFMNSGLSTMITREQNGDRLIGAAINKKSKNADAPSVASAKDNKKKCHQKRLNKVQLTL